MAKLRLLFIVLFSFMVLGFTTAQVNFQVRDNITNSVLKEISLIGFDHFILYPNGLVHIDSLPLISEDSIIVFHPGYELAIFYKPYIELGTNIYLEALSSALDELIISVDRSEQNYTKSTGAISLQSNEAILKFDERVFASALNALPGVFIQSGTSNTHRLSIRGIGSRTPYSTNRIRAWLDDLPLTDGNGVTIIEDIDPEIISSVEVLKGPGATLYGSGPGGVLKINTTFRKTADFHNKVKLHTGSYGSIGLSVDSEWNIGNDKQLKVFASRYQSDGYRQNNNYKRNTFFLKGKKQINNTNINFILLYNYLFGQIPSSLNASDFEFLPKNAAQNWNDIEGYEAYHRISSNLTVQTVLGKNWSNNVGLSAGYKDPFELRPFNILDENAYFYSVHDHLKFYRKNLQVSMYLSIFMDHYKWKTFTIEERKPADLINAFKERKINSTGSIMANYHFTDNLIAEAGCSLNFIHYKLTDQTILEYGTDFYKYDPVFSPMLGINYNLFDEIYFYASARHGFSPPSIEESLLPDGEINTSLKPESGWMTEFGIKGKAIGHFNFDMSIYSMDIRNMLVTKRFSEENFYGINAGRVQYRGLEVRIEYKAFQEEENRNINLHLGSSFTKSINTFIDFIDDGRDQGGNELPGIPNFVFNNSFKINWKNKITFHFSDELIGEQFITDDNSIKYGPYHLSHFSIQGVLAKKDPWSLRFTSGIRNVFNEKYASMLLINAASFGENAPRYYYPGQARNWFVGLELRF